MSEGERGAGGPRYTAFLSYSHRDAAAAGRLHRRLETYRMPKRLVGSETARGPVPERLAPIFRDRDELPAATDLSATVRAALADSGALIVLCSPDAAASLWVAEEIDVFRRLHPDRPILAAILHGDPPDCFPPPLRAFGRDGTWHEPLATDLRPRADGAHLGLLKLVAGITGVGLDALVQRDAHRKIRRVMAVTVGALIGLLVMTALALVALGARREAERQRAEAEGQIEFMLTDLRARLKGVGRLDIMTAVNQRALRYYGGQEQLAGLSPESLERRARILHAMGEDDVARGNLDAALLAFQEAHRTTAEQLARAPGDPERIFTHAQSEFWIGRVHRLRREWPAAIRHYERYAAAAERLIAIAPGNPDYMMEMGWGAQNLGGVHLDGLRNPVAAQGFFESAVQWFERAQRARPGDETILAERANSYGWLADAFYNQGLWSQSLAWRLREYPLKEQLYLADPANLERAYRLAVAERSVARLSALAGDRREVGLFMLKAYRRMLTLTARDSRNADWLILRAKIECDMLSRTPGPGAGLPRDRLERSIRAAAATLSSQHNPGISELSPCLDQLGRGRAP